MPSSRKPLTLAVTAVALSLVAGCGAPADKAAERTGQSDGGDQGKVKLSVVSLLPGSDKAAFKAFDDQVAIFEKEHPDIDVEGHEYEWKGTTFAAQLAGGTLPTVFEVPFTDTKSLIENKQIVDITAQVRKLPYADSFNPSVLAQGQDSAGNVYALPKGAYGIGLQMNRDLFQKAGLDPDKPPATWDQVRSAAKQISERTGQAGFAMMGKSNTGGWNLTSLTYALGGRMQEVDGSGKATATVDNAGTKQAL